MFNFFADEKNKTAEGYIIDGSDYNHIKNVLRLKSGDTLLVSVCGKSDLCEITDFGDNCVFLKTIKENAKSSELSIDITLFQGLPKSDKLELIIQKTTELGVKEIFPVEMKNCVVKIEDKKKAAKVARWQSIAEAAAKQSKRNLIPKVGGIISFKELLAKTNEYDLFFVPFENAKGITATRQALGEIKSGMRIAVLIGPEGGFSEKEIEQLSGDNLRIITLGERILRTETAAISFTSALMLTAEFLGGDSL